jgi:chromosome segregation ATPase
MPVSTSPAEELAQLQEDFAQKSTELDQLKTQLADLSKTVGDIDQKTSAYEKAAGAAGDQINDLTAYVNTESAMLKAALPPATVSDVESKKAAALKNIDDLKAVLKTATGKVSDAATEYGKAKDALASAQASYQEIATLPANNADILKDLTGLRAAAEKPGAAKSLARQYFLVLVMRDRLGD